MSGMNVTGADFWNAHLHNVNLSGSTFTDSSFEDASLKDANLSGSTFNESLFWYAHFKDSDLSGAKFNDGEFRSAAFDGADLNATEFISSDLGRAIYLYAANNVSSAIFTDTECPDGRVPDESCYPDHLVPGGVTEPPPEVPCSTFEPDAYLSRVSRFRNCDLRQRSLVSVDLSSLSSRTG